MRRTASLLLTLTLLPLACGPAAGETASLRGDAATSVRGDVASSTGGGVASSTGGAVATSASPSLPAASAAPPLVAGLRDKGIFPDLDPSVSVSLPPWLEPVSPRLLVDGRKTVATLYFSSLPIKSYPLQAPIPLEATALALGDVPLREGDRAELERLAGLEVQRPDKVAHRHGDSDDDGIPDPVDVLIGGRKTALNGDAYRETYETLKYPGGDVGRDHGVCTDVVIRALRNAGIDLQREIYRDMQAHRGRYGLRGGEKADRNIDHRRVRRQIRWFEAYYQPLPIGFDPRARGADAWLPGDIVFLDTFPNKAGPDHLGIVSDRVDEAGLPLIINNWTDGYTTRDMALLGQIPVTHRFRPGHRLARR